jgi:hypothetical protein
MWIAAVGCLLVLTNAFANGQYGNDDDDNVVIDPVPMVPDTPSPSAYGQKPSYGQPKPKPDTPNPSPYGEVRPKPDMPSPSPNPYGQVRPKPDMPSPSPNPYGQVRPKPDMPNPGPYGQVKPKPDTPSPSPNPYGQVRPKPDTPSPSPYGQVKPKPDIPSPNPYGQIRPKPDTPSPSPYGQIRPKPDSPSPYGSKPAYGGGKKPIITPINPVTPFDEGDDVRTPPTPASCPIGNTWTDIVGCYECEITKSAESCKSQLPLAFDTCANKTALFQMSSLFTRCLSTKPQTCHKLNENMAFAFLLANYDSDIVDLNRRNECLFQRARAPVMQCMSQCDALPGQLSIDNEPIVVCYNELHDQISSMLHDFSDCIKQNEPIVN